MYFAFWDVTNLNVHQVRTSFRFGPEEVHLGVNPTETTRTSYLPLSPPASVQSARNLLTCASLPYQFPRFVKSRAPRPCERPTHVVIGDTTDCTSWTGISVCFQDSLRNRFASLELDWRRRRVRPMTYHCVGAVSTYLTHGLQLLTKEAK